MKKVISAAMPILVFLIGLSLLLYPTLSNYYNSFHISRAVASYNEQVSSMDEEDFTAYFDAANAYNQNLAAGTVKYAKSDEEMQEYNELLDVDGSGIMAYIEIPSIDVELPIYHGTDEAVLQIAAGHIEWSSLPVGGVSTHCVLSGHRGLPSAKLFTNLNKVVVGDIFMIQVLNETLTYEVDQILTVEPEDVSALQIEENKDYCTLVTCTPYGINTHRLLVRGHRVANQEEATTVRVSADALQIEPLIVAPILAAPLLIIAMILLIASDKNRNEKRKESQNAHT